MSRVNIGVLCLVLFMASAAGAETWREQVKLVPDNPDDYMAFGISVDIDGSAVLVSSAAGPYMHLYADTGTTWEETGRIATPGTGMEGPLYGLPVALSGTTAAAGTFTAVPGGGFAQGACIFQSTPWGVGTVGLDVPRCPAHDYMFAGGLALGTDLVVVGSSGDDESGVDTGAVYFFQKTSSGVERTRLAAADGASADEFGYGLALDGDRLVVGAPGDDGCGSVYIFQKGTSGWTQQAKLTTGVADSSFGTTVDLSGDTVVVGALGENDSDGAAYVYEKNGPAWTQVARLTSVDGGSQTDFGGAVAIDGDELLVGAPFDNDVAGNLGAVYAFRRTPAGWTRAAKLKVANADEEAYFGYDVAIDNGRGVAGNLDLNGGGGAWIFSLEPDNADYNADGKIDGGDLAIWQQNYDPLAQHAHWWNSGDANGDGKVDGGDLALWQQGYNPLGTASLSTTQAVPEPATLTLLLLGGGVALVRRR